MQSNTNSTDGGHALRQDASTGAADSEVESKPTRQSATVSRWPAIQPVLLTDDQCADAFGISVRKWHELRSEPWMPKPVVLGPRLLRWPRAELESAIALMPRQMVVGEAPACTLRGKIESLKLRGVPA